MNKILVICEGEKTEPQILEKISNLYNRSGSSIYKLNIEIFSYNTNIYNFYKETKKLIKEFEDIDSVDTIDLLKCIIKEKGTEKDQDLLKQKFSSIYLIFDFDFQDKQNQFEEKTKILMEMSEYFYEDTERGLLLINYPMIEAIKHYSLPILSIENLKVYTDNQNYKKYIHNYNNTNIMKYSKHDIESLITLNIIRVSLMLSIKEYCKFYNDELRDILSLQLKNINNIVPIASILFILPIYFGEEFYKTLPKLNLITK
ncbi:MAG: hypothetical protein R3Y60_03600 [bacterium]